MQIVAALHGAADALVLDEPFSGLDPAAVDAMADLLREHAARGVPVLFSSHQLDLVERLCDHLVVLAAGRVVAGGTADDLRHRAALTRLRLVVRSRDAGWVRDVPGVQPSTSTARPPLLELVAADAVRPLAARSVGAGTVREFSPVVPRWPRSTAR